MPVEVLTAQQEGRLVLFCGAGLSRLRAGLPLFGDLVRQVYEHMNAEPTPNEKEALGAHLFDTALELLERRTTAQQMRQAVIDCLSEPVVDDLSAHLAVLELARKAGGPARLVTTNFDDLFERAAQREGLDLQVEVAPRLRVPKAAKWESLVYLHGNLRDSGREHRDLVLTSGDFGTAYLVERWASRFVTELFREFTVLFVGYGLDDPVFRYLMDALASERAHGTAFSSAFALAPIPSRGKRARARAEVAWESKGVTPIFYNEGRARAHQHLYRTLKRWAELTKGGLRSRQAIALDRAELPPSHAGEDDARLVVWALSEPSGAVARQWAERPTPPSLEWLSIFDSFEGDPKEKLLALAGGRERWGGSSEGQPLVDAGVRSGGPEPLAEVTEHLGRWLARHLGSVELLKWVVRKGGVLHPDFRRIVRHTLEQDGEELPDALRGFWRLVTTEEYAARRTLRRQRHYFDVSRRLELEGWNAAVRLEVLRQLAPLPMLRPDTGFRELLRQAGGDTSDTDSEETTLQDLVRVEMVLAGGDEHEHVLQRLRTSPEYRSRLAGIAHDLTRLLEEALDLFGYLGMADLDSDPSWHQLPSVAEHSQNRPRSAEWTRLVELVRDGFQALVGSDRAAARALATRWSKVSYPVFRRLLLHAATEFRAVRVRVALDPLMGGKAAALWSPSVYRELLRFLRKAGARLSTKQLDLLVKRLLQGPPRSQYRDDLTREEWLRSKRRATWIRLAKLRESGAKLPKKAITRLRNLERQYAWRLAPRHVDEFLVRHVEDWEEIPAFTTEELERMSVPELARLLVQETNRRGELLDAWNGYVTKRPARAIRVLRFLGRQGEWPEQVWHLALNFMPKEDARQRDLWLVVSRFLARVPGSLLESLVAPASQWFLTFTKGIPAEEQGSSFWPLWDSFWVLSRKLDLEPGDDPLFEAMNRPPGHLAWALLQRFWSEKPKRGSLLKDPYRSRMSMMVGGRTRASLLARVILCTSLPSLFAVDPAWCRKRLVRRFSWQNAEQARALWEAYLHNPRIDPELLSAIKPNLIRAVGRTELSRGAKKNLCRLIGFVAIQLPGEFGARDSRQVLRRMDSGCLAQVAGALESLLGSAGDRAEGLWRTSIGPWIEETWPRDASKRTPEVADALAQVAVATGPAFPDAVSQISDYLVPAQNRVHTDFVLRDSAHLQGHPDAVLQLLDRIVPADYPEAPNGFYDLREVLEGLQRAEASIVESPVYQRLDAFLMQRGS